MRVADVKVQLIICQQTTQPQGQASRTVSDYLAYKLCNFDEYQNVHAGHLWYRARTQANGKTSITIKVCLYVLRDVHRHW